MKRALKHQLTPFALSKDELDELKERLLITLYHRPDEVKYLKVGGARYAVIGEDEGTNIAVEEETREIYSVDETGTLPIKFINSDVQKFIASLRLYLNWCPSLEEADDEQAIKLVGELRKEFCQLDCKVMRKGAYWPSILDQIEAGLL